MKPTHESNSSALWGNATMAPSALKSGDSLGRYQIVELLGRGGMGEVWKAYDPHRESHVVVKLLPLMLLNNDFELQRIRESFKRVHALQHQHICPVHDLACDDRVGYYLVMKHVEGETLAVHRFRTARDQGAFSLEQLIEILRPIAQALDYAHGQCIVHRDVKPQNIMVRKDGADPQLVDFGLADEIRMSTARVSSAQIDMSGTYAYMSPEQWRGRMQDGATDQYAMGVVAYEMLAGRPPFESADPQIMRMCVLEEAPAPLGEFTGPVSDAVTRALSKEPSDRYASCAEFVDHLESAAKADPYDSNEVSTSPNNAADVPAQAFARPTMSRRPNNLRQTAVTIAMVVTVLVSGWLLRHDLFEAEEQNPVATQTVTTASSQNVAPPQNQTDRDHKSYSQDTTTVATPIASADSVSHAATPLTPSPQDRANKELIDRLNTAKQQADNARQAAQREYADRMAGETYSEAEQLYLEGNTLFAESELSAAIPKYLESTRRYYDAIEDARRAEQFRRNSRSSLQELASLKATYENARNSADHAPEHQEAVASEARLHESLETRDYGAAAEHYESAKTAYLTATSRVKELARLETARAEYQELKGSVEPALLDRYGGDAWRNTEAEIDRASESGEPAVLVASYTAATALLPKIRAEIEQNELQQLIDSGEDQRVAAFLWPKWGELSPDMREAFVGATAQNPGWWLEASEKELLRADAGIERVAALIEIARTANALGQKQRAHEALEQATAGVDRYFSEDGHNPIKFDAYMKIAGAYAEFDQEAALEIVRRKARFAIEALEVKRVSNEPKGRTELRVVRALDRFVRYMLLDLSLSGDQKRFDTNLARAVKKAMVERIYYSGTGSYGESTYAIYLRGVALSLLGQPSQADSVFNSQVPGYLGNTPWKYFSRIGAHYMALGAALSDDDDLFQKYYSVAEGKIPNQGRSYRDSDRYDWRDHYLRMHVQTQLARDDADYAVQFLNLINDRQEMLDAKVLLATHYAKTGQGKKARNTLAEITERPLATWVYAEAAEASVEESGGLSPNVVDWAAGFEDPAVRSAAMAGLSRGVAPRGR